ncbi:MAG: hypothetical protein NXI18_20400 [Alphaproteobacteria bacterium]|nr:hypothetical protein [Alphaproteobacteria bacterium]
MHLIQKFWEDKTNPLSKYKILHLGKKKSEIETYKVYRNNLTGLYLGQFLIQRKRKKYEYLKKHQDETIDIFKYKYPLGAFAGSQKFIFRVTFKEYKVGLKPAKFSLLLNQFKLNLDQFISLVNEILINNFPLEFYENFFGSLLNDVDFKIHFLVVLRTRGKNTNSTKFYIIPKGLFITHLREKSGIVYI